MWDILYLPVLLFGWFALFRWVLPSLGIPTCLGGACGSSPRGTIDAFDRQEDRDRPVAGPLPDAADRRIDDRSGHRESEIPV